MLYTLHLRIITEGGSTYEICDIIYILRASPPAAGPLKVTGTRDLWFCVRFCCIGSAWNRLGVTFCEPGDALKNSAGPSDLQLDLLGLPVRF